MFNNILIKAALGTGILLTAFMSGCIVGKNSQKLKYLEKSQQLQQDIDRINITHENIQDRPY